MSGGRGVRGREGGWEGVRGREGGREGGRGEGGREGGREGRRTYPPRDVVESFGEEEEEGANELTKGEGSKLTPQGEAQAEKV